MSDRPIGIFDSGVGGLTVFREVALAVAHEPLIYFGDSARVPYGTKSADTVLRYSREAAAFLMQRDIKMLVIACNTATAAALPQLAKELPIPVIGVVQPGAEAAVAITRGNVGVIATEATVRSGAYSSAIHALNADLIVTEVACPLFVALVEEGWANTRVAREVAEIYLEPLVDAGVDTLVLGCTHYPLLKNTIAEVMGSRISIVDSAETTAARVAEAVASTNVSRSAVTGSRQFLVTDAAERFRKIAGEFLEQEIQHLELVAL